MVSKDKQAVSASASVSTTGEQQKAAASARLGQEVAQMNKTQAGWTAAPTAFDAWPAHEKPFPVEPFHHERSRLPFKMSDEDRQRRAKFLHAQELTDREPMNVPELERMIYNPIRRLYRWPADKLFNSLAPVIGEQRVRPFRVLVPKLAMLYMSGVFLWYQFKYNSVTWESKGGFKMVQTQGRILPGDEVPAAMKPQDYADNGFQSRTVFRGDKYAY